MSARNIRTVLGTPKRISDEDIAVFEKNRAKKAGTQPHVGAIWRYYAKVSGAED